MALTNSRRQYGAIAKWLHWLVALLVFGSYVTVYTHLWVLGFSPLSRTVMWVHFCLGISIGSVMILRLIWRLTQPRPSLADLSPTRRRLARLSHAALYALLIIMPVTGYLSTGGPVEYFGLFTIPGFFDSALFGWINGRTGLTVDDFSTLMNVHQFLGAWVIWALVAAHASAGFYHHWIARDDHLRRMTTGIDPR